VGPSRFGLCVAAVAALLLFLWPSAADNPPAEPSYRAGSLAQDEPQAIYSSHVNDAANRLFYLLFTRTVKLRAAEDFLDAAPFLSLFQTNGTTLSVSERVLERIESGDRAIEPLHPFDPPGARMRGVIGALSDPRFARLEQALRDALVDADKRPALQRALLQSDVWAAYDIVRKHYLSPRTSDDKPRCEIILALCAKVVKKLALTAAEAKALPDNLTAAARAGQVPDLLAADGPWIEVEWFPGRSHDFVADCRRASRVFVKPASPPADRIAFVNALRPRSVRENGPQSKLAAVALVTQLLLVDTGGHIVPTRLTYEVQVRTFVDGRETLLHEAELSRKMLLRDLKSGGFTMFHNKDGAYLPFACNDLFFASQVHLSRQVRKDYLPGQAVLVSLQRRCAACHGDRSLGVTTFGGTQDDANPLAKVLKPTEHEHAAYVIERKMERDDFKALRADWEK
jgi:hypothetical protein